MRISRPYHFLKINEIYFLNNKTFLIKLFKNFQEQVENFFNVTSSKKNSAILLKSKEAIKLKYLNRLKCWSNPISLSLLLFCDNQFIARIHLIV